MMIQFFIKIKISLTYANTSYQLPAINSYLYTLLLFHLPQGVNELELAVKNQGLNNDYRR